LTLTAHLKEGCRLGLRQLKGNDDFMKCNCFDEIKPRMTEQNVKFSDRLFALALSDNKLEFRIVLPTEWRDKARIPKGKAKRCPQIWASFCPLCGTKIAAPTPNPQ
jgi:hypothetical protein